MDVALGIGPTGRVCGPPIRLHLGAGNKRPPGYVHLDIQSETKPDVEADAADLHVYATGSVDVIYACHLLEHFTVPGAHEALREWNRVLIPQYGVLRIAVPDFKQLVAEYRGYGTHLERIRGMLYGGQKNHDDYHKSVWDYETLACSLLHCGYFGIKRWNCHDSDILPQPPNYWDYSMIELNGVPCSLNVEARCKSRV